MKREFFAGFNVLAAAYVSGGGAGLRVSVTFHLFLDQFGVFLSEGPQLVSGPAAHSGRPDHL